MRPSLVHALLRQLDGAAERRRARDVRARTRSRTSAVLGTVLALLALAGAWRDRWLLYATLIAVADVVALGLKTRAHSRYIALAIVLLVAGRRGGRARAGPRLAAPDGARPIAARAR